MLGRLGGAPGFRPLNAEYPLLSGSLIASLGCSVVCMQSAKPLGMLAAVRNHTVTETPPTKLFAETTLGVLLQDTLAS
jgi:hypothetical protein